jgi:hypothetical protein
MIVVFGSIRKLGDTTQSRSVVFHHAEHITLTHVCCLQTAVVRRGLAVGLSFQAIEVLTLGGRSLVITQLIVNR